MQATAQSYQFGKAPKLIQLLGDKTVKPESAEHIIEFPGGAIEIARTSDGHYWAHILINRKWATDEVQGMHNQIGLVIDSRVDNGQEIQRLRFDENIRQIAVLIGRET